MNLITILPFYTKILPNSPFFYFLLDLIRFLWFK